MREMTNTANAWTLSKKLSIMKWRRIYLKAEQKREDHISTEKLREKCIDSILFYFQKAFDSVSHERLLAKLAAYGIVGKTANWIKSFLTNMRQRVIVENGKLEWANVTSGIPQGSVLGPILFVDDTTIYRTVYHIGNAIIIQEDLNKLIEWFTKWQLTFNAKMCKVMHLGS